MKFKVGSFVRYNPDSDLPLAGQVGIVKWVLLDGSGYFIHFFNAREIYTEWCCKESEVIDAGVAKVLILQRDNITTAKLIVGSTTVANAQAKCSPSDDFNFLVGAQIALSRLTTICRAKVAVSLDVLKSCFIFDDAHTNITIFKTN